MYLQHRTVHMAGKAVIKVVNRCNDAEESQVLDLSECQLMSIPDAIYHLMRNTVLVSCDLSCNVLRKIPPKFAIKFTNLTELNLSHNRLSTLPDELHDLTDLKRLDISHNDYFSVPKVVFKIPHLTHFNAQKNCICEVDVDRLTAAPMLKEVNLEENPLTRPCHDKLHAIHSVRMVINLSAQLDFDDEDFFDDSEMSSSPSSSSDTHKSE